VRAPLVPFPFSVGSRNFFAGAAAVGHMLRAAVLRKGWAGLIGGFLFSLFQVCARCRGGVGGSWGPVGFWLVGLYMVVLVCDVCGFSWGSLRVVFLFRCPCLFAECRRALRLR